MIIVVFMCLVGCTTKSQTCEIDLGDNHSQQMVKTYEGLDITQSITVDPRIVDNEALDISGYWGDDGKVMSKSDYLAFHGATCK